MSDQPVAAETSVQHRPRGLAQVRASAELFRGVVAIRTAHLHLERALQHAPELLPLLELPTDLELDAQVNALIAAGQSLLGKAAGR